VTRSDAVTGPHAQVLAPLGALALALLATAACAPNRGDAYQRAFADGERAETAGRFGDAAASYDRAAREGTVARDREHAAYLAARMLLAAGDRAAAAERLTRIAGATPPREDSAGAALALANLAIERGDEGGYAALEAIIRTRPASGAARAALHRLSHHWDDTRGPAGTAEALDRLAQAPEIRGTEIEPDVVYARAQRVEASGDLEGALAAYLSVADRWPYPQGAFFDDALFRASEVDEHLGRYQHAVDDLERMLAQREVADLSGSYQRPRYSPGLFRIGVLYRDRLHDPARAIEAFHRLYAEFTTSLLRDDALWEEALLWASQGDAKTSCARLETLVATLPDSRYVPCAIARCPAVQRPPKSDAPQACHAYIERR
jgi:tetratricopeptide (TPR) repeat protein